MIIECLKSMGKQAQISSKVVICGIASLTIIGIMLLYYGFHGYILASIVGAISLAIGIVIPRPELK